MKGTDRLKDWEERLDVIKSEMVRVGRDVVKEIFDDFFMAHPEIKAVGWVAYTPYWCDGDVCEFYVNEMYAWAEADLEDVRHNGNHMDDFISLYHSGRYSCDKDVRKDLEEIFNLLGRYKSETLMKAAFGDHVFVCVTPTEIRTKDYSDHN